MARWFVLGLLLTAAVVFLAPWPDPKIAFAATKLAQTQRVYIVGNSVLSHVSKCDADARNLVQMLGDDLGAPVTNGGWPGQSTEAGIGLASIALRHSDASVVVVALSTAALVDEHQLNLQSEAFMQVVGRGLESFDVFTRLSRGVGIQEQLSVRLQPFSFKGRSYPDYNGVARRYFNVEKTRMKCPETLGHDLSFIEAFQWATFGRGQVRLERFRDLGVLQAESERSGKKLVVVLMPIDFDAARGFDAAVLAAIENRRRQAISAAREAGVDLVDLSEMGSGDDFVDRYCACGHLSDQGRRLVTDNIARNL